MLKRFYRSAEEWSAICQTLKQTPCPHCKKIGTLIRHGFLHGYDEKDERRKSKRAYRVFCNNRKAHNNGCGKTWSVWAATKIRRLSLNAASLWKFFRGVAAGKNKLEAFRDLGSTLSSSAPYRIWKRLSLAQSRLRTLLANRCPAPDVASQEPVFQVIAHLEAAFGTEACPMSALQLNLQTHFFAS